MTSTAETPREHSNESGHQPIISDADICTALQILLRQLPTGNSDTTNPCNATGEISPEQTPIDIRIKTSVLQERFSLTKSIKIVKALEERGVLSTADASFTRSINIAAAKVLLRTAA